MNQKCENRRMFCFRTFLLRKCRRFSKLFFDVHKGQFRHSQVGAAIGDEFAPLRDGYGRRRVRQRVADAVIFPPTDLDDFGIQGDGSVLGGERRTEVVNFLHLEMGAAQSVVPARGGGDFIIAVREFPFYAVFYVFPLRPLFVDGQGVEQRPFADAR